MASTYSDLKFELIGTGEQSGTWGATTNTNLGTAIEQAIAGKADITFSSTTETLTLTNTNAAQDARAIYLNLGGTPGGAATLEVPAIEKPYIVKNGTGQTVTVKVSGQTGVAVPNGATAWLYNNGTDVTKAIDYVPSLTLGAALPLASGGTGQTTASAAINALVPTQTGNNGKYLTTNGSAVSWGTISGTGDVVGPASATDNGIALFDGTTGKLLQNSSGQDGVIHGITVGRGGGSVSSNVCLGSNNALAVNTTGQNNVAVGHASMFSNTTGSDNTFVGTQAGVYHTTGQYNTGFGHQCLLGDSSGLTGSNNTSIGRATFISLTSGNNNVGLGYLCAGSVSTGTRNTFVGTLSGDDVTTGDDNTAVGYGAYQSSSNYTNSTCIGAFSNVTGGDQVQLGDSSTTTYVYGTVQNRSDERDKSDIRDTQLGLNFITALRPVDYKWDMREDYKTTAPVESDYESLNDYKEAMAQWKEANQLNNLTHDGTHKRNRYHHGLIAQEVKQVMDTQGIDFGGYQDHTINGGRDVLSIGYDELVAPMIKAIQELTTRLEAAEAEIAALKG